MGYYMTQRDSSFNMNKENFDKALEAIKTLGSKENLEKAGDNYSWVDMNFVNATNIEQAFEMWRWEAEFDKAGNIDGIQFRGEKYGGDEIDMLKVIAPYVENGSYIEMQGEEGELWRWVFNDGNCREVNSRIVWEE